LQIKQKIHSLKFSPPNTNLNQMILNSFGIQPITNC